MAARAAAKSRRPNKAAGRVSVDAEVTAALRAGVRQCLHAAAQRATLLQSIASQLSTLTMEISVEAAPDVHRQRAHELRGAVLHGLTVLAELQHAAGRLETLAMLQETVTAARDPA